MDAGRRATAPVIDFAAYRAARQQRTLWDDGRAPGPRYRSALREPSPSTLSDRQLAHRRRMLAFLLTPR
jgi:hypothetical protein